MKKNTDKVKKVKPHNLFFIFGFLAEIVIFWSLNATYEKKYEKIAKNEKDEGTLQSIGL